MPATKQKSTGAALSDEELEALQETVKERKRARRGKQTPADLEAEALAKIAEMPESDRAIAERFHSIVKEAAPQLTPKTWYGMPAYADANDKIVCFFTPGAKFKERYASLGFNPAANLDDGTMWPTAFAITEMNSGNEERIAALVRQAASGSHEGSRG
jgi:uncharacterized protein YdhG (YjbR/CyaY superfamily)